MLKREDGFGTIEVVIILAILVGIALVFKTAIGGFVGNLINGIIEQDFSEPIMNVSMFHVFF